MEAIQNAYEPKTVTDVESFWEIHSWFCNSVWSCRKTLNSYLGMHREGPSSSWNSLSSSETLSYFDVKAKNQVNGCSQNLSANTKGWTRNHLLCQSQSARRWTTIFSNWERGVRNCMNLCEIPLIFVWATVDEPWTVADNLWSATKTYCTNIKIGTRLQPQSRLLAKDPAPSSHVGWWMRHSKPSPHVKLKGRPVKILKSANCFNALIQGTRKPVVKNYLQL